MHLVGLVAGLSCLLPATIASGFNFEDVAQRARQLAEAAYNGRESSLPKELANLNYDGYRDIRFKPSEAYWRDAKLPFEVTFFHEGWHFREPVKINEIVEKTVREIKFDATRFDYGRNKIDPNQMHGLGFAGFRIHYPINTPKHKDEALVFLGASYFRALGKGQRYGLSARGLAVDTAVGSGEEFPRFVEFWLERPNPSAKALTIYGLLDSRRATGAYRFVLSPGITTSVDVTTRLYLREGVDKLGVAPLTSMFFFAENQRPTIDDYRPEVHDSDGLSIHSASGEWIWRPLSNPKRLLVTSFALTNPRGFGLMQRDRAFTHYEDLEARYDLRPSAWVEPKGSWGPGRVELVEIPVSDETNDNIVAYWVPANPPKPKQPYDLEYRLLWQKDAATRPPLSWVVQTRHGQGYTRRPDGSIAFVIDFEGAALRKMAADAKLESIVSVDSNAELLERNAYRNEVTEGWRVTLRLRRRDDNKPVELRAYLRDSAGALSETWSYILPPD